MAAHDAVEVEVGGVGAPDAAEGVVGAPGDL